MSIDFHRLMEPINNNRLIFMDYIDYIDCFPMIDFHRLDRPGFEERGNEELYLLCAEY